MFPQTPLTTKIELQAGVWTDVTTDVYHRDRIAITRGRADEAKNVDPGSCSLTFNNRQGKYSPRNPMSPYYGLIGRNTPMRVSVQTGPTHLELPGNSGDRASTPDHASLDITGDIDIRMELTHNWWTGEIIELAGKYVTTGNQRSWRWVQNTAGGLSLTWSPDGTSSLSVLDGLTPVPAPTSGRIAVRVTLDVNNGAGGHTATFYTAPTIAGPWTQLGTPVTGTGTTSVFSSTAPMEIGDIAALLFDRPEGKVYKFELRNGIDGPIVANPDFTAQTPGATSFTDGAGRLWTVAGAAAITNRHTRMTGEVSSWPPRWDVSGKDVYVPVQAAGVLRRLGQGDKPLQGTLRRFIPAHDQLLAYWPLEDGADTTQPGSALPGGRPMVTTGLRFAANSDLPSSDALPTISTGATLRAPLPALPAGSDQWRVELVYYRDTLPSSESLMISLDMAGAVSRLTFSISSAQIIARWYDSESSVLSTSTSTDANILSFFATGWSRLFISARPNGTDTEWRFITTPIGEAATWGLVAVRTFYATPTQINTTWGSGMDGMPIGHITYTNDATGNVYGGGVGGADDAWRGERAITRLRRLASEETLPLTASGLPADSERVGPQRIADALELVTECAEADGGILYEQRDQLRLQYRPRVELYNRPVGLTLDYEAQGEVSPPLEPTDDDRGVRNDITVQRRDGASARAVLEEGPLSVQAPPDGVGVYDEQITLNLHTDDQPAGHAAWRLHLGTWDETRYPVVHVRLHAAPHLIDQVLALEIGDVITIANPPSWLPPEMIRLAVEGYTETIGLYEWDIEFNCSPAGPWQVGVADDPVLGRADTDGSQLASAIDATQTSISVAVTAGPLWTTSAAEMPFDIRIGGEVMRVTAVSSASSPQTFTVQRSINGIVKAHSSSADVRLDQPSIVAL